MVFTLLILSIFLFWIHEHREDVRAGVKLILHGLVVRMADSFDTPFVGVAELLDTLEVLLCPFFAIFVVKEGSLA